MFFTVCLCTHFCPGVACSITTRPRTTSTLLSHTAPGYVAKWGPHLRRTLRRQMLRKLYFKWTIAICDFAKQTLMRLRSLLMRCLLSLQPFCSLIQIHGHNRARQRDKLGHILEEFATLQDEVIFCLHFFLSPTFCCFTLLKTNFPATLQSLTLPLCSTGREGGRSLAQPADETRAAAAASSVPRHLDPVSQPADHDPVPAQWLRTGALQHARVLLHLLVRLHRRVLRAL